MTFEEYNKKIPIAYKPFVTGLNRESAGDSSRSREARSPESTEERLPESVNGTSRQEGGEVNEFHEMRLTLEEWDDMLMG